jgi:BspA type Leucine rich repeat region (6 copies)
MASASSHARYRVTGVEAGWVSFRGWQLTELTGKNNRFPSQSWLFARMYSINSQYSFTPSRHKRAGEASRAKLPSTGSLCSMPLRAILPGYRSRSSELLPLLLIFLLPAVGHAQFNTTTNNGAITITKYTGAGGAVAVPGIINGLPVTSIAGSAFAGISSVTSVTITNNVGSIGDFAFDNCVNLSSVIISNSVTNLGNGTFESCPALTNATLPNSITGIGIGVFYACSSLGSVALPNSIASIGSSAFESCYALTNVTLGNGVTNIGTSAFESCTSLPGITIPNGVTNISSAAFEDCTSLTNVNIPGSVISIGDEAFADCTSLTNVNISNGVASIGNYAFTFCVHLAGMSIPDSVTNIGSGPFSGCSNLAGITVGALNSVYSGVAGVLFNFNQTTLVQFPGGYAGGYSIPDSVVSIGEAAFEECESLTLVTIPNGVNSLGDYAFYDCTNLTGAYFEGNAPGAGSSVLTGDGLATVYYPAGTTGWGSMYGGRPTVLWNPHIRTGDASFGVQTNQFGFNIIGTSNLVDVVEACTDLANPVWSPIQTNVLTGGLFYFSDPQWTNFPARFYQLSMP